MRPKVAVTSTDPGAPEQIDDDQKDDRADERHEDGADTEGILGNGDAEQWRDEPSADERADDADDHVQQHAFRRTSVDDQTRDPANQTAHD